MARSKKTLSKTFINKINNGVEMYFQYYSANNKLMTCKCRLHGKKMAKIKRTTQDEFNLFKERWAQC